MRDLVNRLDPGDIPDEEDAPPLPLVIPASEPIDYTRSRAPYRTALLQALEALDVQADLPPGSTLVSVAAKEIQQALLKGNGEALRRIADRLDGKAIAEVEVRPIGTRALSELSVAELEAYVSESMAALGDARTKQATRAWFQPRSAVVSGVAADAHGEGALRGDVAPGADTGTLGDRPADAESARGMGLPHQISAPQPTSHTEYKSEYKSEQTAQHEINNAAAPRKSRNKRNNK